MSNLSQSATKSKINMYAINYIMEDFKFYMINLEYCKDRKEDMYNMYNKDDLICVNAYDGRKIANYKDIKLPKNVNVKPNEFGCSLSHIKAIKNAYENNEKEIFVIEDDTHNIYKSIWEKSLKEIIENKPEDTECLIFYSSNPTLKKQMMSKQEIEYIPFRYTWSTGCYYINRNGMEKIYNKYVKNGIIDFSTLKERNDIIADQFLIYSQLQTYIYNRPTFTDQCKLSTIHQKDLTIHELSNEITINYFIERVIKNELI